MIIENRQLTYFTEYRWSIVELLGCEDVILPTPNLWNVRHFGMVFENIESFGWGLLEARCLTLSCALIQNHQSTTTNLKADNSNTLW